jgi:hypothetical protein
MMLRMLWIVPLRKSRATTAAIAIRARMRAYSARP